VPTTQQGLLEISKTQLRNQVGDNACNHCQGNYPPVRLPDLRKLQDCMTKEIYDLMNYGLCTVKEAGIGAYRPRRVFFRQQHQGFLEKFHHAASRAAVAAPQPAVQQKVRFGQHRHQRMMRGPSVLAWVGPRNAPC
jgi:hypothetical protein